MQSSPSIRLRSQAVVSGGGIYSCTGTRALRIIGTDIATKLAVAQTRRQFLRIGYGDIMHAWYVRLTEYGAPRFGNHPNCREAKITS